VPRPDAQFLVSESVHIPELVLVYDSQQHIARWLLPATAWTVCRANPRVEIIEETHPHFDAYVELAGGRQRL
jgi:hypothetical protein